MVNYRLLGVVVLVVMLLSACGSSREDQLMGRPTPSEAKSPSTGTGSSAPVATASGQNGTSQTADTDDPGLNLLVLALGEVELKRRTWSDYTVAPFGTELQRGDLLRLDDDGGALVLCDGLTTWEVPTGAPAGLSNGCPPPAEALLVRGGSLVGNTRGGNDALIPYVISPRKTDLLTDRPILRWNPVPGAAEYTVGVRGQGADWSTTTTDTSIQYPGDPPLQPGQTYAVLVEADNGAASRDEGVPGLGFTMLDEAKAASVTGNIDKIQSLMLGGEAEAVALGQYLAGQNLIAEAVDQLEAVAAQEGDSPTVYRMLGDLYRGIGLNLIALEAYENAIAQAEEQNASEVSTQAKEGLAEVYVTLGDRDEAVRNLTEAIAGFEALGDGGRAAQLGERLTAVKGE